MLGYSPEADVILAQVEAILAQKVNVTTHTETTRWQWDAPDVMTSWYDSQGVQRNIHVVLSNEDISLPQFDVEISASFDVDVPSRQGEQRIRHWHSTYLVKAVARQKLPGYIDKAFRTVLEWTINDLTNVSPIPVTA